MTRRITATVAGLLLGGGLMLAVLAPTRGGTLESPRPLPAFTHPQASAWLNGPPLTREDLQGSVALIDIWAFDCWNCYRSFPWLKSLEARYADRDFRVIGVHAPEFEHERKRANVAAKIDEFGLEHPVMMDNDFSYWRALGNRYWPTYYVVDRDGRIRGVFIGETHADSAQARRIDQLIETLLADGG